MAFTFFFQYGKRACGLLNTDKYDKCDAMIMIIVKILFLLSIRHMLIYRYQNNVTFYRWRQNSTHRKP